MPKDEVLRTTILSLAHDYTISGHFGVAKTLALVQRLWTWLKVEKDVEDYVKTCYQCQRMKAKTQVPYRTP